MAAYAALVSLMNNIEQIMSHPRLSTSLDNKHIQPLVEKAAFLLDYIEGCHNHGGGSNEETEVLERRIAAAAHAAEDVIESHIVDQIHSGTNDISLRCWLDLPLIIQDIDNIIEKATENKRGWREEKSTHTTGPFVESGETAMVGLDDELIRLLDELTGDRGPSQHIISIVGMGGMGKTTLAKNIYQHALTKEHFDIRAWATISQQYNAQDILLKLLSSIERSTSGTIDALGVELHKTLYNRRYLIVLDDIWSVEAWDQVRLFFPDNGNRSRVVLTTRYSNVVDDCGSSCLKMDLLDVDKSWKLFCNKASFPQKEDPPQLEDCGKEIVESCKGLALSIVVIGGLLLKAPRTVGYWKGVAKDINSIIYSKEKKEILDVLSLSYNHLPPHLKPCFLYMGVFREDSKIRVSNTIKLWVGEGFLKSNGSQDLEEVAEGYINDLIDRNLISVGRRRSNGKIGFCSIHDLLRDLCLKIAKEEGFFHERRYSIQGTERHISSTWLPYQMELPLARSVIGLMNRQGSLIKCRLLRVLVEDSYGPQKDYYGHVNLRYLSYQHPYSNAVRVWELPSSVSLIWNLQTLIIKLVQYNQVLVAPAEFWKMRQLRHIQCEIIYLPNPLEDEVLMLDKLKTLKTALNVRLCEKVCNLIPNIKKLHLKYDEDIHGYDKSYIEYLCNLERFHKLESLNMRFDTPVTNELNKRVTFPTSLKKLSLRRCGLGWEDMTMIGSLPHLEVLKLDFHSVTKGEEWRPVNEQFIRLKFLKIYFCRLIEWNADNSHFPVLEKLILIRLGELKEIPSGVGEIPTLQLIRVDCCSESAAVSAIRIKKDRLEYDENDDLQIQVMMYDSNIESFKEKWETEDLTIDNIQLEIR